MSGIVFWMSITRYSARWITLCEESRRTRRCRQQPPRQAVDRLREPERHHWGTQAVNERIPRYGRREPRFLAGDGHLSVYATYQALSDNWKDFKVWTHSVLLV